eukprot:gb/GFBE01002146.1/.p1 GENE.gb/GFBE01002146.1/~~gb/GFBE01002146.1/.p1  ORF type:complete len:516 (+),score=106.03 gb/GFBE01002146.1/:1-1548(+)
MGNIATRNQDRDDGFCFRGVKLTGAKNDDTSDEAKKRGRSSSHWHVGHRSQVARHLRTLRSKLGEASSASNLEDSLANALRECETLAKEAEALLAEEDVQQVGESELPLEVQKWLNQHWSAIDCEDLSPKRKHHEEEMVQKIPTTRRSPVSEEMQSLLDQVGTADVDTVAVNQLPEVAGNVVTVLFMYALRHGGVWSKLPVSYLDDPASGRALQDRLMEFMKSVDKSYLDAPYHNNAHAADVGMIMHWFFQAQYMQSLMTPLDHLLGLIGAMIHDVGHDGVNNVYHVKTQSELALRYNDRSPLENMHCALAFDLMNESEDKNWLKLFSKSFQGDESQKALDLRQYGRKVMIEMILSTDTTRHDALMTDLKALVQSKDSSASNGSGHLQGTSKQKQDVLNVLLHAADVSNATRKLPIALYWSRRVLMEFWAQGDQEKSICLEVSPLCDRASGMASVPQGQLGFISFIVRPLYTLVADLLPETKSSVQQLEENVKYWQQKKEEQADFEASFAAIGPS